MKAIGWWCGLVVGILGMAGSAAAAPGVLAYDEAGNYTPATFTNGSNLGTGYGAWDLWNKLAELGDSTAGGGGDLNSTNGYSFRFMGDGAGGWCNGRRNFDGALQPGDVLSFTFTYNWDGGGRGVDIFCSTGQFANVIDVSAGNTFKVNGATVSTNWSPGAVVDVQITQQADGVQVHLTRATNGTENLNYTTNILNAEPATGFSLYCGGYTTNAPDQNPNYAIFMNDIQILGEERKSLTFTDGVWSPAATGEYYFAVTRSGPVSNDLVLTSSNTNSVTVPAGASFLEGSNTVSFNANIVSLTAGPATIVASNADTGVWAEYVVTPVAPSLAISGSAVLIASGPASYTLTRSASAGTNIVLSSSDTGVLTVPAGTNFAAGSTSLTFNATPVAFGEATLAASNPATGAWTTFAVEYQAPALFVTGPATVDAGDVATYTVAREGAVGDTVNLASSDTNILTAPASVTFASPGALTVTFQATGVSTGAVTLTASNDDATSAPLDVTVTEALPVVAYDEAGNYTVATFTNGANLGTGFGAWDLWNTLATLGDSTAGGGGDLNSTNGYSFRFMGDGAGGWCNGKRNFSNPLPTSNVLSFTFTYNWDGGNRGVDIFCATGQFANLINVSAGNDFRVNGTTLSTEYSPGAVVEVEITQLAGGIQMYLTRSVGGVPNLTYATNIVNAEAATGISMYCGGYTASESDNPNYAICMNDLEIRGVVPATLAFTGGTWNPSALGDYSFELTRSATVGDEIVLTSLNTNSVQVPASVNFAAGSNTVSFLATVVSLAAGDATIVASNAASGAWAEYTVRPQAPGRPPIETLTFDPATGDMGFALPAGYTLGTVQGADTALVAGDWAWSNLVEGVDYTLSGDQVTILTDAAPRQIIRIGVLPE